jgi:S-layer protein
VGKRWGEAKADHETTRNWLTLFGFPVGETGSLTEALAAQADGTLPASYSLTDATVDLGALAVADVAAAQDAAQAIIAGATNAADLTLSTTYTLADSLANLTAADPAVVSGAASYSLTDAALTAADVADVAVADLAAAQTAAVDAVRAEALVAGATNGANIPVNNGAYTLADSLANLTAADAAVVSGAASYSLTDAATNLGSLPAAVFALVQGAANAADYTFGEVGQTFALTTGVDTLTGTAAYDTFTATTSVVIDPATGIQHYTDTLQAIDSVDGGAGVDTLKIVDADGTVTLPTLTSVEVIQAQSLAGLTIDTSAVDGLTNLNVTKVGAAGAVDATAAATTDVDVSMKAVGAAVAVAGGQDVNVSLTNVAAATNAINVGADVAADPVGAVTITATGAAAVKGANVTMGDITVGGGTSINVTQHVGDASALVADGATTTTHTQGDVAITASAATTTVTVKQDAAVTANEGAVAVAGVTEVASVKFTALAANATATVGGLTFTAAKALTAAEVAQAFANLSATAPTPDAATGDTQGSGVVANGVFSGSLVAGWNSGVANGDTVTFTAATAGNVTDLVATGATVTTTQGVEAVEATAATLGVVDGVVSIAADAALKTVTVDGYGYDTVNSISSGIAGPAAALDTLNLSNGGDFTVADTADTLALNLENVAGALAFTAAPLTLNVKSVGDNIAPLTAAATTALNVSGTGVLFAGGSTLTNLNTIKVTETAGLNLGGVIPSALTSVDTTGTTGTVTVSIDGSKATYAGGAGVDNVTVTTAAVDKAIDLGAGDDRLDLSVVTPAIGAGLVLQGGDGTDTLALTAAGAAGLSATSAFEAQINGFEKLDVANAAGESINLDNLDGINYVVTHGGAGLTLDQMLNNATVELTGAHSAAVNVVLKDASGTADVVNLVANAVNLTDIGTVTANGVETINVSALDTNPTGVSTNTLAVAADAATTVNVTGAGNLDLSLDPASTKVNLVDASTATGALTFDTLGDVATTVKGGSGDDVLTAVGDKADVLIGGAGNDTLVTGTGLATLTGGAGNDLFVVGAASANVNSYATITDFQAGDLLQISGIDSFASAKVELGDTAVFQDYANAAINALGANDAGWFQFGGNTYVVADAAATPAVDGTAFANGEDQIVKLTGLVDLSNASFNVTDGTIALV